MLFFQGRCRGIICPRDHYVVDNQCLPLYDTVKGLDINIRIQIIPSQTIPDDISEEFVDGRKKMTDKALNDTVCLVRRQISLWYLPRSNANPTEYYMLDIFLFSPSNVIQYSAAVEQIRQFFLKLKTEVKLAIFEQTNIELYFQFKHGLKQMRDKYLDTSNGKTLKPLMEKGWSLKYQGPHITISEVNWCFRAAFDFSEIEDPGSGYMIVKSTNIIAFNDQCEVHLNHIYLCVDLLGVQRHVHVEEDFNIIQEEITPSDYDNDISGESVVDSARGLVMTMSVVAVIVLLVILYRGKQAMARKQSEESARSNQPTDFVELNVINDPNNADHI